MVGDAHSTRDHVSSIPRSRRSAFGWPGIQTFVFSSTVPCQRFPLRIVAALDEVPKRRVFRLVNGENFSEQSKQSHRARWGDARTKRILGRERIPGSFTGGAGKFACSSCWRIGTCGIGLQAMTKTRGSFILTEAAQTLPLVRRILRDIREARSRLCRLERSQRASASETAGERRRWRELLANCLSEAAYLGVEITPGVRCEALFPFEHQWVGPQGDNKIRPAYFVYDDAQATIHQWFFSGWPKDRRHVNSTWWRQFRPTPASRLKPSAQGTVGSGSMVVDQ